MSTDPAARENHPPLWKHAHFSREELDGARHAYASAGACVRAMVVNQASAVALIVRAERDVMAVALSLSGGNPEMPHRSDGSVTTRQEQLDVAWFHRDRALADSLPKALRAVEKPPFNVRRAKSADFLRESIHYLKGLDSSLAYLNPAPIELLDLTIGDANGEPIRMKQTEYAVVGPHGNFVNAISESFWTLHYGQDFAISIGKLLEDGRYDRQRLIDIKGHYIDCQLWGYDCAAKVAGIIEDEKNDRFCTILYIFDTWLNGFSSPKPGMPFILKGIMQLLAPMAFAGDNPAFIDALNSHAEWWTHMNDAAWGCQVENEPLRKRCGRP